MEKSSEDPLRPWNEACERWLLQTGPQLHNLVEQRLDTAAEREREQSNGLLNGFIGTAALIAAIEVGLLNAVLDAPLTPAELSHKIGTPAVNLRRLLACLRLGGVITMTGEGRVALTSMGRRFYCPAAPEFEPYVWPRLMATRLFLSKYAGGLGALAHGQIRYDELQWPPQNERQSAMFEPIMTAEAPYLAALLFKAGNLQEALRILDVGGGDGTIGSLLASRLSATSVDVLNLPTAVHLIKQTANKLGVSDRVKPLVSDFLKDDFPGGYDVVLFSRVLVDWPDAVVIQLLAKAKAALRPGGRVLICERLGTPGAGFERMWLTFLAMGIEGHVFARSEPEWRALLATSGLSLKRMHLESAWEGYGLLEAMPA